jgi:MoaA/NifB/PqqE/SkfB family radical SAM enzyme
MNTQRCDMNSNSSSMTNPFYHYEEIWKSNNYKEWEQKQSDEYKEYRRKWVECPKMQSPPSFPISINIEITTACNTGKNYCIMCPKRFLNVKNEFMSVDNIKKILDEASTNGCCAVNLNGAGEPLLHPSLIEIIRYAKEKGFMDIMFHTNATLLTAEISREIIEAGLSKLIVSVDAPNEQIYKKIRPAFDFNKVVNNIKNFVAIRNNMGLCEPIVRMTMVVMIYNKEQVEETVKFWENYVDFISINDCMYFDEYKAFEFDKDEITRKSKKMGLIYICAPLYQQLSVTIHNQVISCSTIYAKNNRVLGNFNENSLKEIWEGPILKEIREMHEKGLCFDVLPCQKCDLPQIELLKRMRSTKNKVLLK